MSDYVTSPNLPGNDKDIVRTPKEFSGALTLDLTDAEIKRAMEIIVAVKRKYSERWAHMSFDTFEKVADQLEIMADEVRDRMANELDVLATVDGTPVLNGEPPVIEIIGKLPGSDMDKYGMDHERKEHEVKLAAERNEDYLGQKGS